jgi:hypothetical protein
MKRQTMARIFGPAVASAALWGAWAYYANRGHGGDAFRAGAVQAATSFVFTVLGALILEFLYLRFARLPLRRTLTTLGGASTAFASMLVIHTINRTPNLWLTVLPVFALVLLYCTVYVQVLARAATADA